MRFGIITSLALAAPMANAWGDVGHRTVGYLAEKHLSPKAAALCDDLLANDRGFDISDAACWADAIKRKMPWTRPWHYINPKGDNPPTNCTVEWPDDCKDKKGCVVSAIVNHTSILVDPSNPPELRKNATMFLLHLIGDVHQPLHTTGFKTGGNDVEPVCWNKKPPPHEACDIGKVNLHSVWDSSILHKYRGLPQSGVDNEEEKVAAKEWAAELFAKQSQTGVKPEDECTDISSGGVECVLEWVIESNRLVCDRVIAPGEEWIREHDLSKKYYEDNKLLVEEQVARAGLRLAGWLNAIADAIPVMEGAAFEHEQTVLAGDL